MSDDDDLAALREQTSQGDRIDEASEATEQQEFVEDIVAELEAIENGEKQKTVSVWDGHLAAFIRALEENPERLENVGQGLQRRLDLDPSEVDRSELLRLALRLGFQQVAPEEFDAIRQAAQKQATKKL